MPDNPQHDPGLGNLVLGYLLLGLQPIPVSLLAHAGVGPAASVLIRFSFGAVAIAAICFSRRRGLKTAQPGILAIRGLLGGAAVLLYFYSIQHAGAARGTLLNYTYPLWANLIAAALGTRPHPRFWFGLAFALVGVWLVVVPAEGLGPAGIGTGEMAGIASSVFAGGAVVSIKQLRKTDESLTIICAFSVFGILMSAPFVDGESLMRLNDLRVGIAAFSVGILAFLGHVFFTRGYRGVSVAHATLLSLLVPVIASCAGVFFLGEHASVRFWAGAVVVLSASAVILGADAASKSTQSSNDAASSTRLS